MTQGRFITADDINLAGGFAGSPSQLKYLRRALARVRSGTARAKIAYVGPSTIAGLGAGTGSAGGSEPYDTGMIARAIPAQVSAILNAHGIPSHWDNWFGNHNYFSRTNAIDPRLTVGPDVTSAPQSQGSIGGQPFRHNVASTTKIIDFQPMGTFNAMDLYFVYNGNFGSLGLSIDATLVDTIDTNNVSAGVLAGVGKKTYTSSNASPLATTSAHAISTAKAISSTNQLLLIGMDCWNTASPKIAHYNLGWGSVSTVTYGGTGVTWSPAVGLAALAPDLTFIMAGPNDAFLGETLSAYETALRALVAAAQLSGDAVVTTCHPDGRVAESLSQQYYEVARQVALNTGCAFLDLYSRYEKSATNCSALGYLAPDNVHGRVALVTDEAQAMASLILNA